MDRSEEIKQMLYEAIDELNNDLPNADKMEKSMESVLFGMGGRLSSIDLVNLVVAVEERIEEKFGVAVSLADERAMSEESSPLSTVGTLASYIDTLLNESGGA